MDSRKVLADFQLIKSRVSKCSFETYDISSNTDKVKVSYDFDYCIKPINKNDNAHIGNIEFLVYVEAKIDEETLFKVHFCIEGLFAGNINKLDDKKFEEMLKVNGLVTLSQLSRANILSITSLLGINPAVKIPMINIFSLIKYKEQECKK